MEAITNITNEFKPIIKNENETDFLKTAWDVEAATGPEPKPGFIIVNETFLNKYYSGIVELPDSLTREIESLTELYITQEFYYNDLQLVNSDLEVYLIDNFRKDDFKDSLRIELNPDYNPLYNKLPDAEYYFNTDLYNYNPYYADEGEEALQFLTWEILQEYAEGRDFKTELTTRDILNLIGSQDPEHQRIIKTADYSELLEDIQTAYQNLIKEYLQEAREALQEEYYETLYYPAWDQAEQEVIREHYQQVIPL